MSNLQRDGCVSNYFKASWLFLTKGIQVLFHRWATQGNYPPLKWAIPAALIVAIIQTFVAIANGENKIPPGSEVVSTVVEEDSTFMADTNYEYTEEIPLTGEKTFRNMTLQECIAEDSRTTREKGKRTEWTQYRYWVWKATEEILKQNPTLNVPHERLYAWSMMLLYHESCHNPKIENSIGAQGLFQAIPSTRRMLGVQGKLNHKSVKQQLAIWIEYVNINISGKQHKITRFVDWYLMGLYPAHIGKPDNFVWASKWSASRVNRANYRCNKGLDGNHDNRITIGEIGGLVALRCKLHK